jgi:hypothetical protein
MPGYYQAVPLKRDWIGDCFSRVAPDMLRIQVLSKNKMFPGRGFVKMSFFAIEMADQIGYSRIGSC